MKRLNRSISAVDLDEGSLTSVSSGRGPGGVVLLQPLYVAADTQGR